MFSNKNQCSGQQPCDACERLSIVCDFHVRENESHHDAFKRRFSELEHENRELLQVYELLSLATSRTAACAFHMIRTGSSVSTVYSYLQQLNFADNARHSAIRNLSRSNARVLLNSKAPFSEVLSVINRSSAVAQILATQSQGFAVSADDRSLGLDSIRYHTPALGIGQAWLRETPGARNSRSLTFGQMESPFRVTARPWTGVTCDDEMVSHLVSLFIVWLNPPFRFVDPDEFLQDMRSCDLQATHCSPLLVNSILAYASVCTATSF